MTREPGTEKKTMFHTFMAGAVSAAAFTLSAPAFAQQDQLGTAVEAKAMLEKAVFAVKGR